MTSLVFIDSSVWVEVSRKAGDETLKAELVGLAANGSHCNDMANIA